LHTRTRLLEQTRVCNELHTLPLSIEMLKHPYKENDVPSDQTVFTRVHSWFICALPFVASAAMLTVIQTPIDWAPLAWVAYVPLILAGSPKAKPRRLFLVSYVVSLLYWLGNLYWVAPVTIVGWLVFGLYTALLWPILVLCLRYCRMKRVPLFLASAVLIVGIERMQGFFLGGFFWRFLAHSQYRNITLIQIADIFGAGGVSFLIAMVNGLVAELILVIGNWLLVIGNRAAAPSHQSPVTVHDRSEATGRLSSILLSSVVVGAAVVAAVVYGRWRIAQQADCVTAGPKVALLQSNVPQSVKRTFESGKDLFNGLMEQSKAAVKAGAELVVWPETMVQAYLDPQVWQFLISPEEDQAYDKALREHATGKAYVLVGAYGAELQQHGKDRYLARYNSAFLYRPDGRQDPNRYDKIHLVPFGEVLPLRRSLAWFYELLMKVKFIPYNFDYSLDYGSHYTVFDMAARQHEQISHQGTTPQSRSDISRKQNDSSGPGVLAAENNRVYRFGVMICYEDTVPEIARKFALDEQGRKRVNWMVNISNDGWFVRFKGKKVLPSAELPQHAAVCAFRAVENRLAVVRSVNTGISCVIDSLGRIRNGFLAGTLPRKAMARTGMSGWLMDRVPIDSRTTIFSKYGEWLDFACELCVILLIIAPLSVSFLRSRKAKNSRRQGVK
jgi:apolipoprotein N-acyltransferase